MTDYVKQWTLKILHYIDLVSSGEWTWKWGLSEHTLTHTIQSEKNYSPVCEHVEMRAFHFLLKVSSNRAETAQSTGTVSILSPIKHSSYFYIEELRNPSCDELQSAWSFVCLWSVQNLHLNTNITSKCQHLWPDTIISPQHLFSFLCVCL